MLRGHEKSRAAIDSKGNLYTAEAGTGRRAQKFKRADRAG